MKSIPAMRVCTQCQQEKSLEGDFYRNRSGTFGFQSMCKSCDKARRKAWLSTPGGKAKYKEYVKRHKEKPGYKERLRFYRETPRAKWLQYRGDARRRGLAFDFTLDEFTSRFWQKICCYCGDTLETTGVDRLDYREGYTIPNTVPCCYICNIMKRKLSQGAFVRKCRQIAKQWRGATAFHEGGDGSL